MILMCSTYSGESIVDSGRDVSESTDPAFNDLAKPIPVDSHGIQGGSFRITVEWFPDAKALKEVKP